MSFRFLCEGITWSKQVFLPLNDLIKATLEKKDFLNQLESLITLSVRLIRKEIANIESVPNINTFVKLLEEFVFNLNEIHASSDKALPDFDVKITPLIYKFAELVVVQSRLGDCQKEYELKLVRFLNSLPIHPTLHITPCHRTAAFLTSLLSDEISELAIQTPEGSNNEKLVTNVNPPEQNEIKEVECSSENVTKKDGDLKEADEIHDEPSVIPETPMKSSEPTCVGVAAIRGIIPFSSGSFFSLTPPITETTDVCLSVKHQVENPANFPTPSRTPPLIEFQKVLRERFPTPFITPTEKKARRDVIRTLRSHRRPQLSSWNVVETRSPTRSCNLRKQLFVDTDSLSNSANFSSSPLALYLSPDTEKDTPKFSSPDGPSPASSRKSSGKSSTSENKKTKSPVNENNGESYTELKKSIKGNLMGCEASLSDVELMDEIESSINMDNDVIFVESTYTTDDHAEIEFIIPESFPVIYQDAKLDESSKSSNHSANKKTLSRSSQEERRRSSRLAGIPLPLIYSTEPLPDCRRSITSKRTPLQQLTSSKDNEVLSSSKKKLRAESVDLPIQPIAEATPPLQLDDRRQTASWKQVRLQIPPCWADLIENHIKENHPDEKLWYQEEASARWPIVYCNCAQSKRD
ncbi:uncharacterized protein LOC124343630 isoform X2 [Daphnia pulicaria]|uniref:uncharacterized protein LOC124343630 isoform X2 n=1 Tax=Daphnia pulicaria TaxID=35523 RepID=UPI001EEA5667|nr:uncharacterized protein LOC124343630 isoform X2 [Daphnia pulicaria]